MKKQEKYAEFKAHYVNKLHKDTKIAINHGSEPNIMSFLGMPEVNALYPCYDAYADALGDIYLMKIIKLPNGHQMLSNEQAKKLLNELNNKLVSILHQ